MNFIRYLKAKTLLNLTYLRINKHYGNICVTNTIQIFSYTGSGLICFKCSSHNNNVLGFEHFIVTSSMRVSVLKVKYIRVFFTESFLIRTPCNHDLIKSNLLLYTLYYYLIFVQINCLDLSFNNIDICSVKVVFFNHKYLIFLNRCKLSV